MGRKFWKSGFGRLLAAAVLTAAGLAALAALSPETDPAILGRKVADNVLSRTVWNSGLQSLMLGGPDIAYPMVCSRYGVLMFADATQDRDLRGRAAKLYQPFLSVWRRPAIGHVDYNVFGIVPFELHRLTGNPDYLPLAKKLADDEFKDPRPDGLSGYTRFWVDDMYMVGSLQVQAYRSLHEPIYLDRAYAQLLGYCEKLQQLDGLFFHTPDTPFRWGRGNGWAAAAMTEILLASPEDHPQRPKLLEAYRLMMKGLVEHQDPKGLWHQLLDDPESYIETSGSGMFIFALATGARKGWLPEEPYRNAVLKAWPTLAGYLDADGNLKDVCIGTGALNNKTYYLTRPRQTGDLHGQAAFLWAASAVYLLK